jgi:thiol:disulfide interchange protein
VIERNVFEKPESIYAMRNVIAFKVDWSTGVDPEYQRMTRELFDIKGLPHIVIHKPGGERSEVLNDLKSPEQLVSALKRAGAEL